MPELKITQYSGFSCETYKKEKSERRNNLDKNINGFFFGVWE
jgi:hypothetical protein